MVSPFSWAAAEPSDTPLAEAYAACARVARKHTEGFPGAWRLLPSAMRPHAAAILAFAHSAEEFADEGDHSDTERECLLDDWLHRLRATARGESGDDPSSVFAAIGHTIHTHQLPVQLFEDLIGASRQDVLTKRYATWDDVLDYCRRSANPIGRLVLRVGGETDERLDAASDAMCTALRLTDLLAGRRAGLEERAPVRAVRGSRGVRRDGNRPRQREHQCGLAGRSRGDGREDPRALLGRARRL